MLMNAVSFNHNAHTLWITSAMFLFFLQKKSSNNNNNNNKLCLCPNMRIFFFITKMTVDYVCLRNLKLLYKRQNITSCYVSSFSFFLLHNYNLLFPTDEPFYCYHALCCQAGKFEWSPMVCDFSYNNSNTYFSLTCAVLLLWYDIYECYLATTTIAICTLKIKSTPWWFFSELKKIIHVF